MTGNNAPPPPPPLSPRSHKRLQTQGDSAESAKNFPRECSVGYATGIRVYRGRITYRSGSVRPQYPTEYRSTPVWFGTNSIPVPETSVKSVRPSKIPRVPVHPTEHIILGYFPYAYVRQPQSLKKNEETLQKAQQLFPRRLCTYSTPSTNPTISRGRRKKRQNSLENPSLPPDSPALRFDPHLYNNLRTKTRET